MRSRQVTWAPWIDALDDQDPDLGRLVREAVVMREAPIGAGVAGSRVSPRCRRAFDRAEKFLDVLRIGSVPLSTSDATRRASEALRRYEEALERASPARLIRSRWL